MSDHEPNPNLNTFTIEIREGVEPAAMIRVPPPPPRIIPEPTAPLPPAPHNEK